MIYHLAPIFSRNQFGILLNSLNLTNTAVEVGTHRGEFARILLDNWRGNLLYCVDPWCTPPGYEYQAKMLLVLGGTGTTVKDREADLEYTKSHLLIHKSRTVFIRETSESVVDRFANNSLDFVYVDGDHDTEHVRHDLYTWWRKVKPGGILAGHDWMCPGDANGGWAQSIQPCVHYHADRNCVDVYIVREDGGLPWSWYMVKPANYLPAQSTRSQSKMVQLSLDDPTEPIDPDNQAS